MHIDWRWYFDYGVVIGNYRFYIGTDEKKCTLKQCDVLKMNYAKDGANAQALYIRKHGKREYLKGRIGFIRSMIKKTQEILGQNIWEELRIPEDNRVPILEGGQFV